MLNHSVTVWVDAPVTLSDFAFGLPIKFGRSIAPNEPLLLVAESETVNGRPVCQLKMLAS